MSSLTHRIFRNYAISFTSTLREYKTLFILNCSINKKNNSYSIKIARVLHEGNYILYPRGRSPFSQIRNWESPHKREGARSDEEQERAAPQGEDVSRRESDAIPSEEIDRATGNGLVSDQRIPSGLWLPSRSGHWSLPFDSTIYYEYHFLRLNDAQRTENLSMPFCLCDPIEKFLP